MKLILIVDDQPHVIRVLRLTLEKEGYRVVTANDGNEALGKIRVEQPDVLITDIQMAGMDGRELCRALKAELPERKFITLVMTSMTAREEREWVQEMPRTEFLEKPISPRSLVTRLGRHFAAADDNEVHCA